MNLISVVGVTLLSALIVGSVLFFVYFSFKRFKKENLNNKVIINIYLINFFIFSLTLFSSSFPKFSVAETQSCIVISLLEFLVLWGINHKPAKPSNTLETTVRRIKETKCSCQACGNVWYYGKQEVQEINRQSFSNFSSALNNVSNSTMCCSGCLPAAYLPREQITPVKDLNKCPKCNSQAVKKEEVIHEV